MIDFPTTQLNPLATGRQKDLFSDDIDQCRAELLERIAGSRVLVIGGAGSIGAATVRTLIPFRPAALHVVDHSENSLVELVRDLRSTFEGGELPDFRTLPLNFGSPVMRRFLRDQPPYDYVLNFAALKHVRSEKDIYSVLQMVDTNVVKPLHLLRWLAERGGVRRYFCVSTDKAANPVNLMGATKRLMEQVIFSTEARAGDALTITSSRFANVAFSDGSLLQGWLMRLAKRQPVAVPRGTQRYFVSLQEAGQICLLAGFIAPNRHLLVPRLNPERDMRDLVEVALAVVQQFGYKPELFEDEAAARRAALNASGGGTYPILVTPLDTAGEKPFEEFVGLGERTIDLGLRQLLGVPYVAVCPQALSRFLEEIQRSISSPEVPMTQEELVREIQGVLGDFHHYGSGKSLDQRI